MHVLVTGGAGFVGSHLTTYLLGEGYDVTVADNLSSGREQWIPEEAEHINADLTDPKAVETVFDRPYSGVFHLASRPDVADPAPRQQFNANTTMTYNIVEAMHAHDVDELVFTSTSTVYGEAPCPTPEDYGPLEPISVYGASKLASEGILSTYAHTYGLTVRNVRFANVVGPRSRGAVIPDFIEKILADPSVLTILGNGHQEKSYLHVSDCVEAVHHVWKHAHDRLETFNVGTMSTTSVDRIAEIVCDELGVDPSISYTGGKQGWAGDVPRMHLSIEKIRDTGWEPSFSSDEAVLRAAKSLVQELEAASRERHRQELV